MRDVMTIITGAGPEVLVPSTPLRMSFTHLITNRDADVMSLSSFERSLLRSCTCSHHLWQSLSHHAILHVTLGVCGLSARGTHSSRGHVVPP